MVIIIAPGKIGIRYNSDPPQTIAVIQTALESLQENNRCPSAQIGIDTFGDSNRLLAVQAMGSNRKALPHSQPG